MAEMKIKELYNETGMGSPFIFKNDYFYPDFAETNFLTDYLAEASAFDNYFLKEHGAKLIDFDGEEIADIKEEWEDMLAGIYAVYVNSWAHIYDTLNIAYNPVYNVEEHITTKYGQHETDVAYGAHETEREYGQHETDVQYGLHEIETEYGNTSDTLGSHTDTTTNYGVAMDSAEEKETDKSTSIIGSQTNTSTSHTDKETSKLHTDTTTSKLHKDTETSKLHTDTTTSKLHTDEVDRVGNIGIKSATALATEEVFMRERQIFFKNIFLTISREIGAYYDCNII